MARYRHGWSQGWRKSSRGQSGEWYDSSWELQYMDELDRDPMVVRWTRHHGLRIPYRKWWGGPGRYEPDFLVELIGDAKELREVKGEHLLQDPNTVRKLSAGEAFCQARRMAFRVVTRSLIDPEIWAPSAGVGIREAPATARPAFAEDLQASRSSGCLTSVTAGLAVIVVLGLTVLLFF